MGRELSLRFEALKDEAKQNKREFKERQRKEITEL
jgi:hypothetical protein